MRTRKAVGEMRPSALLNHPSLLLYMAVKWAGLRRGRIFPSQIRVAKGVSVYSVVNLPTKEPSKHEIGEMFGGMAEIMV